MKRILSSLSFAVLMGVSGAAYAGPPIQMLPPLQNGGNDAQKDVCTDVGGNKVLTWDGINPLKCRTGVVIDGSGNVGVGTTTPAAKLDVNGRIRMNQSGVGGLLSGAQPGLSGWTGKELVLTVADGAGTDNDGIWIGPNVAYAAGGPGHIRLHAHHISMTGNNVSVGIGTTTPAAKLDVAGGVKVANDGAACSAANAGSIRWTGSTFQGCNGTDWKDFSTGPQFGGIYQTYLCDTKGTFILPKDGASGGCRTANAVTGKCSCPSGFTLQAINDFNVSIGATNTCPQVYYENRGMLQWLCVKP